MSVRLDQRMVAKTANYTVRPDVDRCGTVITNRGATGPVTFTLPLVSPGQLVGLWYEFQQVPAQTITVMPPVAATLLAGGVANANFLRSTAAAVGGRIHAQWDGTQWIAAGIFEGGLVSEAAYVTA